MDHMRRDEIVAELEGYQHKIRLGFASVTVGDVVQLISDNAGQDDTIERLTKERDEFDQMGRNAVERSLELAKQRDEARDEASSMEEILGLDEMLNILESGKPVHPKWAGQAAGTIRRLQKKLYQSEDAHKKERDELAKRIERMHRPRCHGLTEEEVHDPCQFCGARLDSDVCRDEADFAVLTQERDEALAEVERLKAQLQAAETSIAAHRGFVVS